MWGAGHLQALHGVRKREMPRAALIKAGERVDERSVPYGRCPHCSRIMSSQEKNVFILEYVDEWNRSVQSPSTLSVYHTREARCRILHPAHAGRTLRPNKDSSRSGAADLR